jgi:hypothetical protein
MTTQEKVVGMVQEGRGVGGNLSGFFKQVSEFFILQQEQWSGRLVQLLAHSVICIEMKQSVSRDLEPDLSLPSTTSRTQER